MYITSIIISADMKYILLLSTIVLAAFCISYSIFRFFSRNKLYANKDVIFEEEIANSIKRLDSEKKALIEINRLNSLAEVSKEFMKYTIDNFGFDYIIISQINHHKQIVSSKYFKTTNPLVKPSNWLEDSEYRIYEDKDILCNVIINKKLERVIGREVNFDSNELNLNEKICIENNHHELNRIFLPILHRKQSQFNEADDVVIGVIEAGFHEDSKLSDLDRLTTLRYSYFVDSFEHAFYKASLKEEDTIIDEIADYQDNEADSARSYLKNILDKCIKTYDASYGDISFVSFNRSDKIVKVISLPETNNEIIYNYGKEGGIVWNCVQSQKPYFSNDVKNDSYYIEINKNVNSEVAIPIFYSGQILGVVNIETQHKDAFNSTNVKTLTTIFNKAIPVFFRKKFNETSRKLINPFNFFSNHQEIYSEIYSMIKKIFYAKYLMIWERNWKDDYTVHYSSKASFSTKYVSPYLKDKLKETNIDNTFKVLPKINSIRVLYRNKCDINNREDINFEDFCQYKEFNTVIIVPIKFELKRSGFITIYSERNDIDIYDEWETLLLQIADKTAIAFQYSRLILSIQNMTSRLLDEQEKNDLSIILESARQVLLCDLVFLLPCDRYLKINKNQSLVSGEVLQSTFLQKLEQSNIFSQILNGSHEVWISNYEQYDIQSNIIDRENIKSIAIIRLIYKKETLGLLCFCYRTEQIFNERISELIRALSSFSSVRYILSLQLNEIHKKQKDIQIQYRNLKFDYNKIYEKMNEMLPLATRTSFYLILEALNHDIRNTLISLQSSTMDIGDILEDFGKKEKLGIQKNINEIDQSIEVITNQLKLFDFKNFNITSISPNDIINDVTKFFNNKGKNSIVEFNLDDLDKNNTPIEINKAEFSMIIYNLITNAIDAIIKKNKDKKSNKAGSIEINSKYEKNFIKIMIKDNGIGIDNSIINKIFEPGFSRKEKGIGIGLYFVKEVVENKYGGTINVESTYMKYTNFIITLPIKNYLV